MDSNGRRRQVDSTYKNVPVRDELGQKRRRGVFSRGGGGWLVQGVMKWDRFWGYQRNIPYLTFRWFQKMGVFPPKWMVKIMENPMKLYDLGGKTHYCWKHPYGRFRRLLHRTLFFERGMKFDANVYGNMKGIFLVTCSFCIVWVGVK